jgi:hypothetical protein
MIPTNGFSFETIENFDDHIAKSIPNYDLLVQSIVSLAPYFLHLNPQSLIWVAQQANCLRQSLLMDENLVTTNQKICYLPHTVKQVIC